MKSKKKDAMVVIKDPMIDNLDFDDQLNFIQATVMDELDMDIHDDDLHDIEIDRVYDSFMLGHHQEDENSRSGSSVSSFKIIALSFNIS